jgi:AraC-like DNA-binding protein
VYQVLAEEQGNTIPTLRPTVHDRKLAKCFRSLFDALTASQANNFPVEEALVITLSYAFRHHGNQRPSCLTSMPVVHQILQLIDREPAKPFSLGTMAEMAGVSRFHLVRAFSRATGTTPHAYILQRRVRLARRLLAAGRDPIEASVDAGFADQSHMTRAFVRQLGISPARYRQAIVGAHKRAISFKTTQGKSCKLEA